MKPRLTFRDGKWWCRRMGVTGCGSTIQEAYEDMWKLYWEAVSHRFSLTLPRVRC